MSRFRRFEVVDPFSSLFVRESEVFAPRVLATNHCFPPLFTLEDELDFTLDLLNPIPKPRCTTLIDFPSPFDELDTVTDLIQIERTPFRTSTRRVQHRVDRLGLRAELSLQSLCDRVAALEQSFDSLVNVKPLHSRGDRKYTWTAEISSPEKDGFDRKYKWTTEIKSGKKNNKAEPKVEKNYKWTAEIKGKDEKCPILRTYTFKASTGDASDCSGSEKKEKKDKKNNKCEKVVGGARVVEIEEATDHGAVVLRQAFAKRPMALKKSKGKKKELSPQDAAIAIQVTFRAYLIRRSKALRALRELAIAKTRLKEIRALFNNYSYRRRLTHDAEECQKFSERIIVLLLTVDAVEGADLMVRAAKKAIVDELEAMLDVVDPQPLAKSFSMKRRMFDMPDGVVQKELAQGVAQVVQMIDAEENGANTFEASL